LKLTDTEVKQLIANGVATDRQTARETKRAKREPDPPNPDAIVRFYPNPVDVIRAYVESDFQRTLATEHERKVAVLADEGAAVTDAISCSRVEARLVDVATHRKAIEAWFAPIADWAYRLHRVICDRRTEVLAPLKAFEDLAKSNAQTWRREDERLRREEAQRLEALARQVEQDRLAREAELLEARGEHELATQVLEAAVDAPGPVIVVATTLPKTKGVSYRPAWKWRPVGGDTPEARARALHLVPRDFLELSDVKLNAWARAHGNSKRIPGIEFYDAGTVSVRAESR
jgi:hypothetical protein